MFENENGPFPSGVGDPEGRELNVVRGDAELASRACQLIDEAMTIGRQLTLGRESGPRQFVRLERSRDIFARLAVRDTEIADELARYQRGELDWVAAAREGKTRLARKRRLHTPTRGS